MISNLSEVPPNWIKVRFEEIAQNITDRIEKPNESGLEYYIGLEHLDTDQIRIRRFGSTEDVKATKFLCKKGDIIFGKRNAYLRKIAVTDRDAVVSAHSMVIRPKGDLIIPDFLPCFMQSSVFWKTAHAISEGSMSPTIKWKTLVKQEFWIPSIEEQKQIVETIWGIQDNIEKNNELINITEKLKKGLLNEFLIKGIDHNQFRKTEFGEIPKEWRNEKLADILEEPLKNGINKNKEDFGFGTKFVNVIDNYCFDAIDTNKLERINLSEKEIENYSLKPGDITVVRSSVKASGVAYPALFDGDKESVVFCGFVIRVRVDKKKILPKYLLYYLRLNQTRQRIVSMAGKSALTNINQNTLNNLEILFPSDLDEQLKICNYLEKIDDSIKELTNHLINIEIIRKKITSELLSAKLIIPEDVLENVQ